MDNNNNSMKKHYDILIATPGSMMHNGYVKSLTDTLTHLNEKGISYRWLNGSSSLVHHAREVLMSGDNTMNADDTGPLHGQATYNKMIWIDSDIVWTVDDFMQLYESEHEIVTGAYLLADGNTTTVHSQQHMGGIPKNEILKMKKDIQIQSCGFGFIAIKSGVFERMERPWFGQLIQRMQNSRGDILEDSLGEDVSWCIRAYKAGIPIYFNPKILVTHLKTTAIRWR